MDQGWIKLHRKLLKKAIWQCSSMEQRIILVTLLLMANHREKEWEWNGERYQCEPGEFITSAKSIMEAAGPGITRQNVRTALAKFKKYNFLTMESTKINTKITILNWEKYQSQEYEVNQPINQQLTNDQPTANHQLTTNKNDKNDKNDKNIYISVSDLQFLVDAWNEFSEIPVDRLVDRTKRFNMLRARAREYGIENVKKAIENVKNSSYMRGEGKDGWIATFDWVISPKNFKKVLDGYYNKGKKAASSELKIDDSELRERLGRKL